jgi:hypothetical protein
VVIGRLAGAARRNPAGPVAVASWGQAEGGIGVAYARFPGLVGAELPLVWGFGGAVREATARSLAPPREATSVVCW